MSTLMCVSYQATTSARAGRLTEARRTARSARCPADHVGAAPLTSALSIAGLRAATAFDAAAARGIQCGALFGLDGPITAALRFVTIVLRSSSRLIGQREDRHPSGPAVRLDNRVLHPTGHRDVLDVTKHIGHDTATNRVAQMLLQRDLPARRVEGQEVAFGITREDQSTSGRRDGSDHRGV